MLGDQDSGVFTLDFDLDFDQARNFDFDLVRNFDLDLNHACNLNLNLFGFGDNARHFDFLGYCFNFSFCDNARDFNFFGLGDDARNLNGLRRCRCTGSQIHRYRSKISGPLLDRIDIAFVSPGVPLEIPLLVEARQRDLPLSSETRLFTRLCPAPIVGITGS